MSKDGWGLYLRTRSGEAIIYTLLLSAAKDRCHDAAQAITNSLYGRAARSWKTVPSGDFRDARSVSYTHWRMPEGICYVVSDGYPQERDF